VAALAMKKAGSRWLWRCFHWRGHRQQLEARLPPLGRVFRRARFFFMHMKIRGLAEPALCYTH